MKIYTIRDVAQMAGVSVTTVSRVLNHRPDVNAATREKVEQVIAACNFVGNTNARSLKQTSEETAALILRGRSNPFLTGLAETMLQFAATSPVSFLMESIDEKADEFQTAVRLMHEKRCKGFIFMGSNIDDRARVLEKVDVPLVFATVDASRTQFPCCSSVTVDDRAMGHAAVKALLDAGHRRIAVFGGSPDQGDGLALRYLGVLDAFREAGLTFDPKCYVETRFSLSAAYDTARAYFAVRGGTTAVFAMSDLTAIGVIRALKDIGRRVPEDVSVVGFDGIEMGKYFIPSLTTVSQPAEEIARQSVRVLLEMMRGGECRHLTVDAALTMRESLKAPQK